MFLTGRFQLQVTRGTDPDFSDAETTPKKGLVLNKETVWFTSSKVHENFLPVAHQYKPVESN